MPLLTGAGIYVFCLRNGRSIGQIRPAGSGLRYGGITKQSINVRNHYLNGHSGGSTLRRSLRALLRVELTLTVQPRGSAATEQDAVNFRFSESDERRLSHWMADNLVANQIALTADVRNEETAAIIALQPPLNLTGWLNPQKAILAQARRECREAADRLLAI